MLSPDFDTTDLKAALIDLLGTVTEPNGRTIAASFTITDVAEAIVDEIAMRPAFLTSLMARSIQLNPDGVRVHLSQGLVGLLGQLIPPQE